MLTVHTLKKYFNTNKAVDNVSFSIEKGEIFSLIGPNSSGKTTIIKSILGLLQATSGSITVDGIDISKKPEQAKACIGYIPDEPSLWQHMTGEEFLYFTQSLFSTPLKTRKETISKWLNVFDLTGIEKQYFEDYSRGNKQKFSIIAAMSHDPKLLLVDEPIVGLDPSGAEIAKKLFVDYATKGCSVLLVTHTLPVAEEISHRIGILKNGTLVAVGTLSELRERAGLDKHASLEAVYQKLA
ncbi:MAG: ABC transporter ATP-binding protein [Candidatus Pacebacteria bacterium]|nr:ABC transporter ATP-binding protein [Candidatus Paceibacterota bacterium]